MEQTELCYLLGGQLCSAFAWGKAVLLLKGYTHSTAHSLPRFPVLTAEKDQEGGEKEPPKKKGKELHVLRFTFGQILCEYDKVRNSFPLALGRGLFLKTDLRCSLGPGSCFPGCSLHALRTDQDCNAGAV